MDHEYNVDEESEQEERLIYYKIKSGSLKEVENLLKRGVSAQTSFRKSSLLHSVVECNSWSLYSGKKNIFLRIAELLLDYGADINSLDTHNQTPLHLSLLRGDLDMVRVLLNKILKNTNDNRKGDLVFHDFFQQCQNVIDFLLENGKNCRIAEKEYPILLVFATQNGDEQSFKKILLTKGDFDINYLAPFPGTTVFHTVIEKGTCKMIKDLVNHGAEINKKDKCGNTPLQTAIKLRRFLQVGCLLECGASVFDFDAKGDTALHLVAKFQADGEIVKIILSKGIDVNIRNSITNETPLHVACGKDVETVKIFLENGADLNVENNLGKVPFHRACAEGNFEIVSYLIEIGADINVTDNENQNALHSTIRTRKEANVIRLLLLKGVEVDGRDIYGRTPLHYIGNKTSHDDLLIMKLLIAYGADIHAKDKEGNTPLHEASKTPCFHNLTECFFDAKADVNAQNIYGDTPLSYSLKISSYPYNLHSLSKNIKSLVAHLSKMIALGVHVCEKNVESLKHRVVLDFHRTCNLEMNKMNEAICNRNISMLDFLSKNLCKLAAFVRNEDVLEALNSYSYTKDFPNYGDILERRIEDAKKRVFLMEKTVYIFNVRLKAKLPDLVLDKIYGYLEENDLNSLVDAFRIRKRND